MKRYISMIIMLIGMAIPIREAGAAADMDQYCSAPPYVTRSIAPNVMILMDNSNDMLTPAYVGTPTDPGALDNYVPNATMDNYPGYFKPQSCYAYNGKFVEVLKAAGPPQVSYSYTDALCPSTAPFRGNLMNWATTSKYDILEKVIEGGNTVSKQGHAHTLLGIDGSWSRTYNNCVFNVTGGNLVITENTPGLCTLLDTTPTAIAFWKAKWLKDLLAWLYHRVERFSTTVYDGTKQLIASAADRWERLDLVARAWAAAGACTVSAGSLNGTVGNPYSLVLTADNAKGSTDYTWTTGTWPAWLTTTAVLSGASPARKQIATWTSTPTQCGDYNFTATLGNAGCDASIVKSGTIAITAATLTFTPPALASGTVGATYVHTMTGAAGGVPTNLPTTPATYIWAATGLPNGLAMSSDGVITGIPTAAGTSSVSITVEDSTFATSNCTQQSVTKSANITINPAALGITNSPPDGQVNVLYTSFQMNGSGGIGPYTWTATGLPDGLTMTTDGLISGTPTIVATYNNVTITLTDSASPHVVTSRTYSIHISATPAPTIDTTALANGTTSSSYSASLSGSGGTGTGYTWTITSGYLPFGLTMNSSGVISGNTCPFTSTGATTGVDGNYGATCLKTDTFSVVSGHSYIVSACPANGGAFSGDTYLKLTGTPSGTLGNDDSCGVYASTLSFTASSSGIETVCQSTYSGHTMGTGASPADTSWSYNIKDTTDNLQCAGTFPFTVSLKDSAGSTVTKALSIKIGPPTGLAINSLGLNDAKVGVHYSDTVVGSGGTTPYTWSIVSGLPASLTINSSTGVISGTPLASEAGTYSNVVIRLTDGVTTVNKTFTLEVIATGLTITTTRLDSAVKNTPYLFTVLYSGGYSPYAWSAKWCSGSSCTPGTAELPANLTLGAATGIISGTPGTSDVGVYTIEITLRDAKGTTVTKTLSFEVLRSLVLRSQTFNIKVELIEENFTDLNGNDIWDPGETFLAADDLNGNGKWDGKQGIFQKFWSDTNPKARWGLAKFGKTGATVNLEVASCIPASPAASFYTTVQNAQPTDVSPLSQGLYGVINYFGFSAANFTNTGAAWNAAAFKGCTNSDPIDNVPCRKNFILVLSSGSDLSGPNFTDTSCTGTATEPIVNNTSPLVQNACFGYNKDLRSDHDKTQDIYTYVVNTMGHDAANNLILKDAAAAGHGKYYDASDASSLEGQLTKAFTDILGQAASGTAVSVLTTSSRGIGSMVQSYFLPTTPEGSRDVMWTGYTKQIWIDNQDNLREDSEKDNILKLDKDNVMKLYFDKGANDTKAGIFTTDADGSGGTLASCTLPDTAIKKFSDVIPLWEAGKKLALTDPSARKLFTSKKVLTYGSGAPPTLTANVPIANTGFTSTNINSDATLKAALQPDLNAADPFSYDKIIGYVRGECLETGVDGNSACAATPNNIYRDRRMTVDGALRVWKLGDVISSTPKVFGNTALNAYDTNYQDTTYSDYVSSSSYKQRSALALIGANDGIVHAFRVGYLKNEGLPDKIKAMFQNFFSMDTGTDKLGEEVWGYIPYNAFPYLRYLADTGYCHIYFNDLSVRLVDASIGGVSSKRGDPAGGGDLPTDKKIAANWKSILVGGMRFGGACNLAVTAGAPDAPISGVGYSAYFAIDITDSENPVPMWEFSDADMGYATTYPSVVRTGAKDKNGNWYVAVGSGSTKLPKSGQDIYRTTPGYVYLINLQTGELVKKIQLDHNAIVGDILAVDADYDYYSEAVYFGTAYNNLDGLGWKGKLAKIKIPNKDLSTWTVAAGDIKYLYTDNYPITASPDAVLDEKGTKWVFAGSGKYFSDLDETDTTPQIFLGMKDYSSITYPITRFSSPGLIDVTFNNVTGTVLGTTKACLYNTDATPPKFESMDLVTRVSGSTSQTVPTVGWKQLFSGGERMITRPLAVGGLVDFLTYKPSADLCSYGGDSYLYSLGYTSGLAPRAVSILAPQTTGGTTTGTVTVQKGILLGPGAPPTGEAIIVPPQKAGQDTFKKKIQVATGVIVEAEDNPVYKVYSKIIHWMKK